MEKNKVLPTIKLSTENYDIIDSGSVVLQMGEYLEFQIENLKFRIVFIDEPKEEGVVREGRISTSIENKEDANNAYFKISFYNQNTAFFSSTANFAQLAIIDGKPLKLKFSIQSINERDGSGDKIFFYSWYLGKTESEQIINNVPQQ